MDFVYATGFEERQFLKEVLSITLFHTAIITTNWRRPSHLIIMFKFVVVLNNVGPISRFYHTVSQNALDLNILRRNFGSLNFL